MIAAACDIKHRHKVGGLTGRSQHGGTAALQSADLGRHRVTGWVRQTGIEIAICFQIEELSHILRSSIFEGCALNNGQLAGFAVSGRITSLNAKCFGMQLIH